jgi:CBS domain-containing protein
MNIASFLTTKSEIAFIYDDYTLRQGLEKMRNHGYSAIPVVTRDNKYISTVSEGDFLWYLVNNQKDDLHKINIKSIEDVLVSDIILLGKNPPVRITAKIEELLIKAMNQNFIPVIDDREYFIGIITRKDIINYFYNKSLNFTCKI